MCRHCKHRDKDIDEIPCRNCNSYTQNGCNFEPINNYHRIKAMTPIELADFICDIYASNEHREIRVEGKWMFPEDVEEWLEREVNHDV